MSRKPLSLCWQKKTRQLDGCSFDLWGETCHAVVNCNRLVNRNTHGCFMTALQFGRRGKMTAHYGAKSQWPWGLMLRLINISALHRKITSRFLNIPIYYLRMLAVVISRTIVWRHLVLNTFRGRTAVCDRRDGRSDNYFIFLLHKISAFLLSQVQPLNCMAGLFNLLAYESAGYN